MRTNIYFTITVDTEADDAWRIQDHIGMRNLSVIPRFQALCDAYDIVPTYMLTYECTAREEALRVLKPISDQCRCELGYHFHSWTTPPLEQPSPEGIDLKWRYAYQYELPNSLYQEKAECLLKAIEGSYGVRPTAHRAGRWGIDQRTVDWLIEHRFIVDTSVVPLWDLSKLRGQRLRGPCFCASPRTLFIWPHSSMDNAAPQSILEVPVTVHQSPHLFPALLAAYIQKGWVGQRMASRIYQKLIGGNGLLRPNPAYVDGYMLKIIRSHLQHQPTVINMMIHSSELMLGQSPFTRTRENLEKLWLGLRDAFVFVQRNKIKSLGITASARMLEEMVTIYESPDFTSGFERRKRGGGILQEGRRKIFDHSPASPYRSTAG
jgi:hypothetical protein